MRIEILKQYFITGRKISICFDKNPRVINVKDEAGRQLIIRLSDQLAAGEIKLIEVTPEESAAAKARLDEVRKKRRERHASKKALYK